MIPENKILKSDIVLNALYFLSTKISRKSSIRNILIYLFFFILYPLLFFVLSKKLNVWKNIEYPLSESLTTYIGDIFLGFITITIISFYLYIPKVINNLVQKETLTKTEKVLEVFNKVFIYKKKYIVLIILFSLTISVVLHIAWWTDGLHGWTERAIDKPSYLGLIHLFLHFIMTYIISTFIWNVIRLRKLLRIYRDKVFSNDLYFTFNLYCVKKCGGFVDFANLFLKGLTPIAVLSVYMTLTIITLTKFSMHNNIEAWAILEFIFALSGYTLIVYFFSNGIIKSINDILIRHKNKEMKKLSKIKSCSSYSLKTTECVNHHYLIEIVSNYPISILNKETMISPKTLRIVLFIISQIIVVLYRMEIVTIANKM